MHATQAFSLLALAGSALAAPGWGGWQGNWRGGDDSGSDAVATENVVVTATTFVYAGGHRPTGAPAGTTPAAVETPVATQAPASSTWATWSSSAAAAPSASAPASSNDGSYMSVVSEWRSKMGMSALTYDSQLEANSLKTVQDGNGQMVHELNKGSMAQVLAPGSPSEFTSCFVGGWLCEMPSLPGLDGICSSMSQGWSYNGETGHAEILSSPSYSKIGCANADGIWGCDLA